MKVLWVTNNVIPEIQRNISGTTGMMVNEGWINQVFSQLYGINHIELSIVCCGASRCLSGKNPKYEWYTLKEQYGDLYTLKQSTIDYFTDIIKRNNPDIIHVWGTEYPHTLGLLRAAEQCDMKSKVVVSIQGLISFIAEHYLQGIDSSLIKAKTLYDILRNNTLKQQQTKFYERGCWEIESLKTVTHVIGRTYWDEICVRRINPQVVYHFCNETLRPPFYSDRWDYAKCQRHSIFVSQASYPIKGFHILLKALPRLVEKYPDLCVYVGGTDPTLCRTLKDKLKYSSYGKILRKMIDDLNLNSCIKFLGKLDAEQMKAQYLRANVFVSCSVIENSPNSLGEAMLLGCPIVASNVGGVQTMLTHQKEGLLYVAEEFYILEYYIQQIFENTQKAVDMGENARKRALLTHDAYKNLQDLMNIYINISNNEHVK